MSRRNFLLLATLVAAAVTAVALVRYFSDEARIGRVFKAVARAVAEEKLLALGTRVSRSYSDPYGTTYESLLGMAADVFATYEALRVTHAVESVSVSEPTASVELSFRLSGSAQGKSGLILGEAATPCTATVLLRKERGDWVIERVERVDIPNAPAPEPAPTP